MPAMRSLPAPPVRFSLPAPPPRAGSQPVSHSSDRPTRSRQRSERAQPAPRRGAGRPDELRPIDLAGHRGELPTSKWGARRVANGARRDPDIGVVYPAKGPVRAAKIMLYFALVFSGPSSVLSNGAEPINLSARAGRVRVKGKGVMASFELPPFSECEVSLAGFGRATRLLAELLSRSRIEGWFVKHPLIVVCPKGVN